MEGDMMNMEKSLLRLAASVTLLAGVISKNRIFAGIVSAFYMVLTGMEIKELLEDRDENT